MKIAHAEEIARQKKEFDKKHKALLTEKLKSEESLRKQAEQEKKALDKDWRSELSEAVK